MIPKPHSGFSSETEQMSFEGQRAARVSRRNETLARLRQSVWEATQYLTYSETREYVESVLREVESDEP